MTNRILKALFHPLALLGGFCLLLLWAYVLPPLYAGLTPLPPLAQLHQMTGIFGYQEQHGRLNVRLYANQAQSTLFACGISPARKTSCLSKAQAQYYWSYQPQATAWWYPVKVPLHAATRQLMQLSVDGRTVVAYSDRRASLAAQRQDCLLTALLMTAVTGFIFLIGFMGWRQTRMPPQE